MNILIDYLQNAFAMFGPFFILLGILIFVHEMGHFLVAKYCGVRVETFSLGFGKKLLSFKRGDTTYCISLIPLGGFVKMYGDDPSADIPEEQKKYAFLHKPLAQRFAVVLAGPLMNLFFAIFIFSFIVGFGEEVAGPFLGDVTTESKAHTSGLRSGDKILSINNEETPTWSSVQKIIERSGGRALSLKVSRPSETQPLQVEVPVAYGENENIFSTNNQIGVVTGLTQESRSTLVGVSDPKGPAALAGIESMSLIVSVNGKKVSYWRELQPLLADAVGEVTLQVRKIDAPDKAEQVRTVTLTVPPSAANETDFTKRLGFESAELYIYQVKKDSPADKAGMIPLDRVVRVGGEIVQSWSDVLGLVKTFDPQTEGLDFTVLRGGEEKTFKIKPEMTTLMTQKGKEERRFTIGIVSGYFPMGPEPVFYRLTNPIQIVRHGWNETMYWTEFVAMSMVRLVQGEVSAKNIGGVITIGRVASHSFAAGLSTFLRMMGLISINLFLLNLLPIPILDGGHLVFYTIEGLRGAPLSMRKMELAQQVGLMLLMFLMAFAFFNDISNLWTSRW